MELASSWQGGRHDGRSVAPIVGRPDGFRAGSLAGSVAASRDAARAPAPESRSGTVRGLCRLSHWLSSGASRWPAMLDEQRTRRSGQSRRAQNGTAQAEHHYLDRCQLSGTGNHSSGRRSGGVAEVALAMHTHQPGRVGRVLEKVDKTSPAWLDSDLIDLARARPAQGGLFER